MIGAFLFRFEKVQNFEMERFSKAMVVYLYTTIVWYLPWLVNVEIHPLPYRYIDGSIGSKENWQSNLTINHLIEIINVKDITFIFSLLSQFLSYFFIFLYSFPWNEWNANRGCLDNIGHNGSKKSTHYLNSRRTIRSNLSLHSEDTSNFIEHSPCRTKECGDSHSLDDAPNLSQNDEHSDSIFDEGWFFIFLLFLLFFYKKTFKWK